MQLSEEFGGDRGPTRGRNHLLYSALTVAERLIALPALAGERQSDTFDEDVGARRFEKWQANLPLTATLADSAQRLYGVSPAELKAAFAITREGLLDALIEAPWMQELSRIFGWQHVGVTPRGEAPPPPTCVSGQFPLVTVIAPLIDEFAGRLRARIAPLLARHPAAPFDVDSAMSAVIPLIEHRLNGILVPPLSVELQAAKLRGQLRANTPEGRFGEFVALLVDGERRRSFLEDYPGIGRLALALGRNWCEASDDFLSRLARDWPLISEMFGVPPDARLAEVSRAGDHHNNGRVVLITSFGSHGKLVYKPRPVAPEAHFQELLDWCNTRLETLPFRTLAVLDREEYGWVEFAQPGPCDSIEAVQRFYRRQGALVALIHALAGTDFHSENVVACGEHPILVDLETLFQADHVALVPQGDGDSPLTRDAQQRINALERTGFVPHQLLANGDDSGVDISGLGGAPGQKTPMAVPVWTSQGTDELRLVRRKETLRPTPNTPSLDNRTVSVRDHIEDLVIGFRGMYALIRDNAAEFGSPTGPLSTFEGDVMRFILRPSVHYEVVTMGTTHPQALTDGCEIDFQLDKLLVRMPPIRTVETICNSERRSLLVHDIPIFWIRPGERHLWTTEGSTIVDLIPSESTGMALVQQRLERMNEADVEMLVWILRASVEAAHINAERVVLPSGEPTTSTKVSRRRRASKRELEESAISLGESIATRAISSGSGVTWPNIHSDRGFFFTGLATDDLYDGLAGISLALAYLGWISGRNDFSDLARRAIVTVLEGRQTQQRAQQAIGPFAGATGLIYVLDHLSLLWDDRGLADEARALAAKIPSLIDDDLTYDVIAGAAGAIPVLLNLHRGRRDAAAGATARACGLHLVNAAITLEDGLGWPGPEPSVPLGGFAHGAAGIAWSLSQLGEALNDRSFAATAQGAIDYDRSLFDEERMIWRDLRPDVGLDPETGEPPRMTHWCHGTVGIGLGRLRTLAYADDGFFEAEINASIEATLSAGAGVSHALCHGDLGTAELLYQAGVTLDRSEYRTFAQRLAGNVASQIKRVGFLSGTPASLQSHGLMRGDAGGIYGLLRLAHPDRIPSVLLLDGPRQ